MKKINDVVTQRILESVNSVKVKLYPASYESDQKMVECLWPIIKDCSGNVTISLNIHEIFSLIDSTIGILNWHESYASMFGKKILVEMDNIEKFLASVNKEFSTPEIIMFTYIFPFLNTIEFEIHKEKDTRKKRQKSKWLIPLIDLKVTSLNIHVYSTMGNEMADMFVEFLAQNKIIENNIMSPTVGIDIKDVNEMFDLLSSFSAQMNDGDSEFELLYNDMSELLYEKFKLYDFEKELYDAKVTMILDYNFI